MWIYYPILKGVRKPGGATLHQPLKDTFRGYVTTDRRKYFLKNGVKGDGTQFGVEILVSLKEFIPICKPITENLTFADGICTLTFWELTETVVFCNKKLTGKSSVISLKNIHIYRCPEFYLIILNDVLGIYSFTVVRNKLKFRINIKFESEH